MTSGLTTLTNPAGGEEPQTRAAALFNRTALAVYPNMARHVLAAIANDDWQSARQVFDASRVGSISTVKKVLRLLENDGNIVSKMTAARRGGAQRIYQRVPEFDL